MKRIESIKKNICEAIEECPTDNFFLLLHKFEEIKELKPVVKSFFDDFDARITKGLKESEINELYNSPRYQQLFESYLMEKL